MTTAELAYRASSDDVDERNKLVVRELPQVYYVAARIRERLPKHVELEDLVQAGVIGLLEACRSYDGSKDAQFSTFAKFRIRGAILDSLRKLDWGSRTLRRRGREITSSIVKLESQLGRKPDDEEIDLIESAPSTGEDNPFELCLKGERKEQLAEAVSQMSEREQLILSLYYNEELTMMEVSKIVGIAVSRVSQIHAAAMVKLRASLHHLREGAAVKPSRQQASCRNTEGRQLRMEA